jgi:formylglycine-generating enzyme required for sulfatase activity
VELGIEFNAAGTMVRIHFPNIPNLPIKKLGGFPMKWWKQLLTAQFALFVVPLALADPPVVSNVAAQQRAGTKLVDISYDLQADAPARILVRVSTDSGNTYGLIPSPDALAGDVGSAVTSGTGKSVVWDMRVDFDWQFNETMRVKVIAEVGAGVPPEPANLDMVTVAGTTFRLGRIDNDEGSGDADELPAGDVTVGTYEIGKFEITNVQYAEYLRAALAADEIQMVGGTAVSRSGDFVFRELFHTTSSPQRITFNEGASAFSVSAGFEQHPVVNVTWYGAMTFCQFYSTGDTVYDLPTEAEWELAARGPSNATAGNHQTYPFASNNSESDLQGKANFVNSGDFFEINSESTTPVGFYNGGQNPPGPDTANGYGVYDVAGNVSEWCRTGFADYPYPSIDSTSNLLNDPAQNWQFRVLRGGAWSEVHTLLRVANRSRSAPSSWSSSIGFRIVRR